jgi:hypothetical protein
MMKSIKRMVLTGAAVMVMMSFALPAMAAVDPNGSYTDYNGSSLSPSAYNDLSNNTDIGTAGEGIPPEAGGPTGVGSVYQPNSVDPPPSWPNGPYSCPSVEAEWDYECW